MSDPAAAPNVRPDAPERKRLQSRASLTAILTIFTTIFVSNLPSPLYSAWQDLWGFSTTGLTAIFAIYVLGVLVLLPTAGPLSDLVGRRQLMIPGMVFTLLATLVFVAAPNIYWLAVGRFLTGVGTGLVTGAATAALLELDPRGNRARAGTISTIVFTAGATIGPLFGSAALRWFPAPTMTAFLAAAVLVLVTITALVMVEWPKSAKQGWRGVRLREWRPQRLSIPTQIIGGFAVAGATVALTWSTGSLYSSLGPSLAVELVGVRDRATAGLFIAAFQFIGGISQFMFRQQPSLRALSLGSVVLAGGMIVVVIGLELGSANLFLMGTIVAALGSGAAGVGSIALVSQLAPDAHRGEILSVFYMIAYVTMATVVLGVGVLSDRIGLKWTVMLLVTLMVMIAIWIAVTTRSRCSVAREQSGQVPCMNPVSRFAARGKRSADYR